MNDALSAVMNIAFTAFAVYGIFVLYKFEKAALMVEEMLEDLKKEMGD